VDASARMVAGMIFRTMTYPRMANSRSSAADSFNIDTFFSSRAYNVRLSVRTRYFTMWPTNGESAQSAMLRRLNATSGSTG